MRRPHKPTEGATGRPFDFGMELIMDISGCDWNVISDPAALSKFVVDLVDLLKMKRFGEPWQHHFGHATDITTGYTVFQAIETSSIVVHVSEGLHRVYCNVFSCLPFDAEEALEYSERFFAGTDAAYTVLGR